jgi:long-subunit fatty acid transport protein
MKIKICIAILVLSSTRTFSQIPEEALRLSWYATGGAARNQAIGGAMGSLGGDATANHINPAGLAFFKTSDFILTPGWQYGKGKGSFRGTNSTGTPANGFELGTSGFILGGWGYRARNTFAITVTKLADFKQKSFYKGQNNYSSFAEPLADEFAASHFTIDQALNSPDISVPTKMALYTYLVDTAANQIIARSENTSLRDQQNTTETSGGISEITFGMGSELSKKFMLGGSFGFQIINLERRTLYHESDASADTDNDFAFLTYDERFSAKGIGLNLRAGIIYRPIEYIRIGLAFHSPTGMLLKEKFNSGLATNVEKLFGNNSGYDSVSSETVSGVSSVDNRYTFNTPAKIMLSGSYVFREVENVAKQKGFITADIEYVNYKWMKFTPDDENTAQEVFDPYNEAIDILYKGTFNFRVGGELKFKTIMARAGFSYYGNPYKDSELKGRKMNISGGLGYRNKGMFLDLTYVHRLNKDVNFPYRVNAPRANTFADLKDSGGNVLLTVGFKI